MRRPTRALICGLMLVIVAALILAPGYFIDWRIYAAGWRLLVGPRARPMTSRAFESNLQRLRRGEYLVNGVLGCFRCHSERDWDSPGGPPFQGNWGEDISMQTMARPDSWLQMLPLTRKPGRAVER